MERQDSDNASGRRWTCEACGCNTNSQSDRTCSICGTSSGPSLLRRAGYAARSGLFARGFAARRGMMNEDIDDLWDRVVDGVDMAGGDDDEQAISALAMEVAGSGSRSRESGRQSILDAARTFSLANRDNPPPDPQELLQTARDNAQHFQPKWASLSQLVGRVNSGNGIEVGEGERQNVAHLPLGAGEGRAVRAADAIPKSIPFNSFSMPSPGNRNQDRRNRRVFGFRVAFDHTRKEVGSSMGGCYLVGVTTSSFAAFGERNGLQQSPFFWGIEDGGNKYEGSRYSHSSRAARRGQANFAVELGPDEAPCNSDSVLFGCREVVTVVVDFETRTLTFWRDSQLLGTLVSNLPRSGNLYPVAVPFNAGVTVSITGMDGDPLQLLRTFASGWKQAQQQKDEERRQILAAQRSVLIINGRPTSELVHVLSSIFSWYAEESSKGTTFGNAVQLSYVAAARLWYRCGMKLSCLDNLFKERPLATAFATFDDFLNLVTCVIGEDENFLKSELQINRPSECSCEVGDRVELVDGYEKYGDASGGPLQPGDRGTVVELQQGTNGERHSIRVLYSGRRWWYQPQAVVSERSRLIESPGVWFLRKILRGHGFDHTTLQPLWGKPLTASSWQVGDIVVPRRNLSSPASAFPSCPMDSCVGRVVAETSSSASSLAAKGRDSGMVLIEFADEKFGEATGVPIGGSISESRASVETSRIQANKLIHSTMFHGSSVLKRGTSARSIAESNPFLGESSIVFQSSPSEDVMDVSTEPSSTNSTFNTSFSVSEKVRVDIESIAKLDIAAIEAITKECKKNSGALASMFSAGLPDAILAAVDCAGDKLDSDESSNSLSQPISALGVLATYIVEKSFLTERDDEVVDDDETDHHSIQHSSTSLDDTMDESSNSPQVAHNSSSNLNSNSGSNSNSRPGPSEAISIRVGERGFMQDPSLTSRISSLQQRRNVLLALMSRARRNNTNSMNEAVERENNRFPPDISLGQILPPYGPFRQGAGSRPFFFGQQSELLYNGSWDELEGFTGRGSSRFPENSSDTASENRRSSRNEPSPGIPGPQIASCPFLSSILQGQGEPVATNQKKAGKGSGAGHFSSLKCLINNGILGNSLRWVKAVTDSQGRRASSKNQQRGSPILKNTVDQDGTPMLLLAICLGCSSSVLNYLIQSGAPVSADELRKAALTNQAKSLSVLLQSAVYSEGMIDLNLCTPEVVHVLRTAWARQEELSRKMREDVGAFVLQLVRKLLHLCLRSRHRRQSQSSSGCSQAISGVLVGHVLLRAVQKSQRKAQSGAESETTTSSLRGMQRDSPRGENSPTDAHQNPDASCNPQGLVGAIPREILCECLLSSASHITQYFLLVEDYLCSKEVGDGAVGLTLLSILLKKFPFLSFSSEMERYGIAELVSSHDVIASTRLADILSRQLPGRLDTPSNSIAGALEQSNVDTSNLALNGVVVCPKKHTARLHITRHSSFRCDLCGKGVERGRPMHGCRECDWDACEECTDKGEGGFVKWSYLKELSLECQKLLSRDRCSQEENICVESWEEGILEKLHLQNNALELERLQIRLLQRDAQAVRELTGMLRTPGQITVHQFVSVILPSLHASLLGRSLENGRFSNVLDVGAGHRSKKPRVVGGSFHGSDSQSEIHTSWRTAFCRDAVSFLLSDILDKQSKSSKGSKIPSEGYESNDSPVPANEPSETQQDNNDTKKDYGGSAEVLRRLHQVLSLYETVTLVSKSSHSIAETGSPLGALQALTHPIEVNLSPTGFDHQRNIRCGQISMTLCAEPLIPLSSLELHVLRSIRINRPSYISFCRRLATDRAIIVEQAALRGKLQNGGERCWRLAQVVGFDLDSGSHCLRYASRWNRSNPFSNGVLEVQKGCIDAFATVQFDEKETKIILAAREYYVLWRNRRLGDAIASKSAFDMERLLSDGIVPETNEKTELNSSSLSTGSRVESNCASSDESWHALTVISVDPTEGSFVLVSDSGEVFSGVSPNQVRAIDQSNSDQNNETERRSNFEGQFNQAARRALALDRGSRAFPFLTSRQQLSHKRDESPSGANRVGALKRAWSALSLIESMEPIEISSPATQHSTGRRIITDGLFWDCSLGDSNVHVVAEHNAVEAPPQIRVEFSAHERLPTVDLSPHQDLTLIGALKQLYSRDEALHDQGLPRRKLYQLFYSVVTDFDGQSEKEVICSGSFPSSVWETSSSSRQIFGDDVSNSAQFDLMKQNISQASVGTGVRSTLGENLLWPESRSRKLGVSLYLNDDQNYRNLCEGFGEICVQCMEVIGLLSEFADGPRLTEDKTESNLLAMENTKLSKKLMEQLEDPLTVVGGALPQWCEVAPMFAPSVFSYESRRLLLERAAFGVSRSALKQQEAKVNVGRLRQRMADLRARAVELVGEAFSGGAEDPTALQLQADELYGMEEALAARVKAAFRSERWEEHSLQVAKAAVRREKLLADATAVMDKYANDENFCRRRLEVRFAKESGFDAASGDAAGVTRGFYADVAEALLSCENVSGVYCSSICPVLPAASRGTNAIYMKPNSVDFEVSKLPLWIPDIDSSGQVVIPTPRADPRSVLGVFPRPLPTNHPQMEDVLIRFRFIGRLFAAALRDGFMFPLPLSSSFLKLVQHGGDSGDMRKLRWHPGLKRNAMFFPSRNGSNCEDTNREVVLTSLDLPRPGFLGGEVFGVEINVCRALERLEESDPPLSRFELDKRYREIATNKNFARVALGKSYDCSFEDYFQDRTFVDPLDPTQGEDAVPLCPEGHKKSVTIYNIREWVALAKHFILHDGVIAQALAFRCGVADFFSSDYLRLFTSEELQRDVCGVGDKVDSWDESDVRKLFKLDGGKGAAEALVAVAAIGGEGGAALSRRFGPSSPTINFLVKALLGATPKQRRQFLSFVTSVPIVTPGRIEVVPVVSPSGEFLPMRDPGCLPRANTCARRLYLPKFESYESFSEVLWAVVREESKFKGFFEWRGS